MSFGKLGLNMGNTIARPKRYVQAYYVPMSQRETNVPEITESNLLLKRWMKNLRFQLILTYR